jgi:HAD superfamily hydrolase (TIGR01509 family)
MQSVFFDMDGVLYDSMPAHAKAWEETFRSRGINCTYEEFYLHEGRPGFETINLIYQRTFGRNAAQPEIDDIYSKKCRLFSIYDRQTVMPGAVSIVNKVRAAGMTVVLVTGSGQLSLLDNLEKHFPGCFRKELMVTAYDVTHGKPHPEPYLLALKKAGAAAADVVVIENAPMGIRSAVAAGICTVAVNTGLMSDRILLDAGADILYPSMLDLDAGWDALAKSLEARKFFRRRS